MRISPIRAAAAIALLLLSACRDKKGPTEYSPPQSKISTPPATAPTVIANT